MQARMFAACLTSTLIACADPPPPAPSSCDRACQDGTAARALRETMKLAFNLTLQGKPVGAHDVTVDCPNGGRVRVFGEASSNAAQGSTDVRIDYAFDGCAYLQRDDEANENYSMTFTGTVRQEGVIAVQPSATTALLMKAETLSLSGTVHEPAIEFAEAACSVQFAQNGSRLSGTLCERPVGVDL